MHDISFLWQLHKDTRSLSKVLGITEKEVRKRLQLANITPPTPKEQKERRVRAWLADITPQIIRTSIWTGRKRDLTKEQYDAINHRSGERFMVRVSKEGSKGWRFNIEGVHGKSERVLLIGVDAACKISCAFYIPTVLLQAKKKSVSIGHDSDRYKNYQVSVERARFKESKGAKLEL